MAMLTESGLRKIIKEELKRIITEDTKENVSKRLESLEQDLLTIQGSLQVSNPREKQIDDALDRAIVKLRGIAATGGFASQSQSITPQTTRFQGSKV